MTTRRLAPLAAALLSLVLLPTAAATHVHGIDIPPDANSPLIDGIVSTGEYADWYEDIALGMTAYFEYGPDNLLRVGLVGPAGGWLGIGFGPAGPKGLGLNFLVAAVNATTTNVTDQYFDGFSRRYDVSIGGTDDIVDAAGSVSGAVVTVELVVPLDPADPYDHSLSPGTVYTLLLAYNTTSADMLAPDERHSEELPLHVVSEEEVLSPHATALILQPPPVAQAGEEFILDALLTDVDGNAVGNARLSLSLRATFGLLWVGNATTDMEGRAEWTVDIEEPGVFAFVASFAGRGGLQPSQAETEVTVAEAVGPAAETPTVLLVAPVAAAVLGGVWASYGFVVFQILEIRREGRIATSARKPEEM